MFQGKVRAALRFLTDVACGSFLPLSATVGESTMLDELIKKYSAPMLATPGGIVAPDTPLPVSSHPVIFDCLDEHLICHTALHIGGAAGPSGLNAHGWRRLCTSFHNASVDLCHSLALVARRIEYVPSLSTFCYHFDKYLSPCCFSVH